MTSARFTPRQLAAFVTVADVRSFGRAGERMALSPSAVSQLVGELETALGFRLFDRTTRTVSLSSAGREFLPSAVSVLKNMDFAQSAADDIRNRAAGVVRIAAPMIIASTVLPACISAYRQDRPKVIVRIRDAPVDSLIDMLMNAQVDLAIGSDQLTGEDIARVDLFKSPWVMWCSKEHPLAREEQVSWLKLRQQTLVVAGHDHERTVALTQVEGTPAERLIPVDIVDNASTAFGIAAQGEALTLAPEYVGLMARQFGLVMRPIVHPLVTRTVCLYQSLSRALSPAAEGFREHLIHWIAGQDGLGNTKP
jgi:DNA-binding transcriptional LysR family regulator